MPQNQQGRPRPAVVGPQLRRRGHGDENKHNNNVLGAESHESVPRTCILSADLDMDIRAVQRGHARGEHGYTRSGTSRMQLGSLKDRDVAGVHVRIWAFEDSFRLPCPCIRFGITLQTPGRLAFPVISYPFRTRFDCRHYIDRPSLQGNIKRIIRSPSARTLF